MSRIRKAIKTVAGPNTFSRPAHCAGRCSSRGGQA
jgi:hypothetical protein